MGENVKSSRSVVSSNPKILGGTLVFTGTRVPFRTLIDYLESGEDLDSFLGDFPSVTKEQVIAALDQAAEAVASGASSS